MKFGAEWPNKWPIIATAEKDISTLCFTSTLLINKSFLEPVAGRFSFSAWIQ